MSKEDKVYKPILDALKITNKKIIKKAMDAFALMDYRRLSFPKCDNCKYHACVEIICKERGEPFSRDRAIKISGAKAEQYQQAIGEVCGVLNKHFDEDLYSMAKRLGVEQVLPVAISIQDHFKLRFDAATKQQESKHNGTVLAASSLMLALGVHGVTNVDECRLLEQSSISPDLLRTTKKQVQELTLELIKDQKSEVGAPPPAKRIKGPNGAPAYSLATLDEPPPRISLAAPIPSHLETKIKAADEAFIQVIKKASLLCTPASSLETFSKQEAQKAEEERFRKWREQVIAKVPESRETAASSTHQTTINFPKASSSTDPS